MFSVLGLFCIKRKKKKGKQKEHVVRDFVKFHRRVIVVPFLHWMRRKLKDIIFGYLWIGVGFFSAQRLVLSQILDFFYRRRRKKKSRTSKKLQRRVIAVLFLNGCEVKGYKVWQLQHVCHFISLAFRNKCFFSPLEIIASLRCPMKSMHILGGEKKKEEKECYVKARAKTLTAFVVIVFFKATMRQVCLNSCSKRHHRHLNRAWRHISGS